MDLDLYSLVASTYAAVARRSNGSGLFSLAARRLGATVHSFDYDPESVACAQELKERYFPDDDSWTIATGSVLDHSYIDSLGHFDIIYASLHIYRVVWRNLFIFVHNFVVYIAIATGFRPGGRCAGSLQASGVSQAPSRQHR